MTEISAYRGEIFYFDDNASLENIPRKKIEAENPANRHYYHFQDGLLIVKDNKIVEAGDYSQLNKKYPDVEIIDYSGKLITPGFIDCHQHATQSAIVAVYGEKLLEWLNEYVFPSESSYKDSDVARQNLNFFLDELLKNGTTTAVCYGPLFYNAADIFFEELDRRNMRFITGNVIMDCNSPEDLCLSSQENYDNCVKLIQKWNGKNRLNFCITPRFALDCSPEMLELCGSLKKEYPDLYIQTHLDENISEIAEVQKVFPWSKNYLDVYDKFGLVTDRSVLGHVVHPTDAELERIKEAGSLICWNPLSNNFLGSGLFNFERTVKYTDKITLGTDWGAGNCLSMFAVLDDVYKISMVQNYKMPSMIRWYMATFGAAKALQLDNKIGNFSSGKEADFIVIDPYPTDFLRYRLGPHENIFELLFVLMTVGDDRNIEATYINGKQAYSQKKCK